MKGTRGVVLSVAFVSFEQKNDDVDWRRQRAGNVGARERNNGHMQEPLLLRAGVVGSRLPSCRQVCSRFRKATLLCLPRTESKTIFDEPQRAGESAKGRGQNLNKFRNRSDDALVAGRASDGN